MAKAPREKTADLTGVSMMSENTNIRAYHIGHAIHSIPSCVSICLLTAPPPHLRDSDERWAFEGSQILF